MFDGLQGKLQDVFHQLRGEGKVTPEALQAAMRQIRLVLLEADVQVRVVKPFVERVRERALGAEVMESLTPAQQVIKVVRDELVSLLGEEGGELRLDGRPAVLLLCGLQGSGKTTTAGKLARRLKLRGRHPLLVAADLQRAAAVEQLQQVGRGVEVPVLAPEPGEAVLDLAARAVTTARDRGHDVVIIDTAGRLHVDEALMQELAALAGRVAPAETLFVADAMTGQDAVRSAEQFAQALPLTGVILTKLDGDSRGGAALSIRTVAQVPIRFVGVGEKPDDLELFHPERMASRMIGMGDVLSLIEKAERGLDRDEAQRLAQRIARQQFTLEDLRDQLRQLRRMGPLGQVLEMLPKVGPLRGLDGANVDEGGLRRVEAIINSMTPHERRRPDVLNGSRKRRIAVGAGTSVQEINRLLKQYRGMQKMFKGVQGKWLRKAMGGM
ncbi:MAG TPA: signal recognition particle protein [Thermoanaerobaculia bacterium]|jgi:signal recognition particle subunit SRP54|nr:signal recognition particle protein [Thermoanaerobaculia bacterium]